MNNWLVIGSVQNWETALSQPVPIWGLKPAHKVAFDSLQPGDTTWFYATAPVSGVIGLGLVKDKYFDKNNPIWPDELKEKKVIWPYRFRIQVLKVIVSQRWTHERVEIRDFGLVWQNGFQQLRPEHAVELMARFQGAFGLALSENIFSGATITSHPVTQESLEPYAASLTPESPTDLSHRGLQEAIAEIGKLQFYHSQLEYPIELPGEGKILDAVWKREINGVPTFAFEVELSEGVERALLRLMYAFNQWNSRPRIIVPDRLFQRVDNIAKSQDRSFSSQLRMYNPPQVTALLSKKRELRDLERSLDIY
jgi:hypothetical protein